MNDKNKLFYSDYNWENDCSDFDELKIIDRYNGHQMLLFINYIMNQWEFKKIETFHRIERMIREDVPIHLNSREIIFKWIVDNW